MPVTLAEKKMKEPKFESFLRVTVDGVEKRPLSSFKSETLLHHLVPDAPTLELIQAELHPLQHHRVDPKLYEEILSPACAS